MTIRTLFSATLLGLVLFWSCTTTKSIASYSDKSYFEESPSIITYKGKYFLRFVYSKEPFAFYMHCESKIKGDSLIYFLPVRTSSGNLSSSVQFQEIIKPKFIETVESKNVFWQEPDGSLIHMKTGQIEKEEIELLPTKNIKS